MKRFYAMYRPRPYRQPTLFTEEANYGERSNNISNTFWQVLPSSNECLAESCVRGAGSLKSFKSPVEAERWARGYAYEGSKRWGGF
ncbi:MAG TPA: hypothetical protein VMW83_03695 [Spirochaetia bacterium]|nr:hypothetical protein [Spirochaetia bacterium]